MKILIGNNKDYERMMNMKRRSERKAFKITTLAMTGIISASVLLTPITASAGPAYDSDFTKTYVFETLIKPALTNPYTDDNGIYEQLELCFRYRVMTMGEVLDMHDHGYTVPVPVLERLYNAGWINSYVYHRAAGLVPTPEDMSDVFDYVYYYNANPDLQAVFGLNEEALFQHFLLCGMAEGRRASVNFDPVYFKNRYPDIAAELGDDMAEYYIHYIIHAVEQGRVGSPEDQAEKIDHLNDYANENDPRYH
jgi:hypothetical protein